MEASRYIIVLSVVSRPEGIIRDGPKSTKYPWRDRRYILRCRGGLWSNWGLLRIYVGPALIRPDIYGGFRILPCDWSTAIWPPLEMVRLPVGYIRRIKP